MSKSSLGESVVQKTVMEVPVRFLSSSSKGGSDWMTVRGGGGERMLVGRRFVVLFCRL